MQIKHKYQNEKKILYLGLDPSHFKHDKKVVHHPVIKIIPKTIPKKAPEAVTHILLTSKTAASLFLDHVEGICEASFIAVGKITAQAIEKRGYNVSYIAKQESQEGVIELLETLNLSKAHVLFPHSSISRPLIFNYLKKNNIKMTEWILYDTVVNHLPLIDLTYFEEIVFTSPSTVDAFISLYGNLPKGIKLTAIGPITQKKLNGS